MQDLQRPFQHYRKTDDSVVIGAPVTYKAQNAFAPRVASSQMPKICLVDTWIIHPRLFAQPTLGMPAWIPYKRPTSSAGPRVPPLNNPKKDKLGLHRILHYLSGRKLFLLLLSKHTSAQTTIDLRN